MITISKEAKKQSKPRFIAVIIRYTYPSLILLYGCGRPVGAGHAVWCLWREARWLGSKGLTIRKFFCVGWFATYQYFLRIADAPRKVADISIGTDDFRGEFDTEPVE